MYCYKCGNQLPEESEFCINCGSKVLKETTETPFRQQTKMTGTKKKITIIAACLVAIIGACVIGKEIKETKLERDKEKLQAQLMRDWQRVESGESTYYTLELDFSDDEVDYNFDSFYIDETIATYKYTVISKNQFKIDRGSTVYTVKFNKEKTMMTITPALTSSEDYENWYCHD